MFIALNATIGSFLIWNKYGTVYKDMSLCANFKLLFNISEWCGHFKGIYRYICGHLPKFDWLGVWTSHRGVTMFDLSMFSSLYIMYVCLVHYI